MHPSFRLRVLEATEATHVLSNARHESDACTGGIRQRPRQKGCSLNQMLRNAMQKSPEVGAECGNINHCMASFQVVWKT